MGNSPLQRWHGILELLLICGLIRRGLIFAGGVHRIEAFSKERVYDALGSGKLQVSAQRESLWRENVRDDRYGPPVTGGKAER